MPKREGVECEVVVWSAYLVEAINAAVRDCLLWSPFCGLRSTPGWTDGRMDEWIEE